MKKMILSAMLLLSTGAYAVDGSDVTANCKTNNQSEVVIKFHNYNPVALISLQIKGQEYKSLILNDHRNLNAQKKKNSLSTRKVKWLLIFCSIDSKIIASTTNNF